MQRNSLFQLFFYITFIAQMHQVRHKSNIRIQNPNLHRMITPRSSGSSTPSLSSRLGVQPINGSNSNNRWITLQSPESLDPMIAELYTEFHYPNPKSKWCTGKVRGNT